MQVGVTPLFLFDFSRKRVHGVFIASGKGGSHHVSFGHFFHICVLLYGHSQGSLFKREW